MTTPTKLRAWRLAEGLTQAQAAARFGKSLRTYSRYERGPDSIYLPNAIMDFLILYSAERHATARKAEQDLNEAYIAKAERLATPAPEPLPPEWSGLPEPPDDLFDDDGDDQ